MRRLPALVSTIVVAWALVLVPEALAQGTPHDNGEGILGETDDPLVTFFSLGVVVFFAAFVIVAAIIQSRLDRRKEEKEAARVRKRIGW
jgi:hypothetical protein